MSGNAQLQDDLVMSTEELARATEDLKTHEGDVPGEVEEVSSGEDLQNPSFIQEDSDLELSNDFWDDGDFAGERPEESSETAEAVDEDDHPDEVSGSDPIGNDVRRIKADGEWHDVDISNGKELDRHLSMALAAPRIISENDKLTKDNVVLKEERDELRKTWARLEHLKETDRDQLDKMLYGKTFKEAVDEEIADRERYQNASPEERDLLDLKKRTERLEAKRAKEHEEFEAERETSNQRVEEAEMRELRSTLHPSFYKHAFSEEDVGDVDEADELNDGLWEMAILKLDRDHGEEADITPAMADAAFSAIKRRLTGNAKRTAEKEVKKITTAKQSAAKRNARAASTRNYKKQKPSNEDYAKFAKDPNLLWRMMTRD
jgi:hypothetical protein